MARLMYSTWIYGAFFTCVIVAAEPDVLEVRPERIDDVLTNPNMGFADFHMGWHCETPGITGEECAERRQLKWPKNYPATAVAYFRWQWDQLEAEQGKIDFDYIDQRIRAANLTGQTLAFRIMAIREGGAGIPAWLRKHVKGVEVDGTFWPDYRDPVFQREHRRFVAALAKRYDDHPAVDHIDIGPVGCWGEWNTACTKESKSLVEIYAPADESQRDAIAEAYKQVIADYADAFTTTPLVMLALGSDDDPRMVDILKYALERRTGWRIDCWGDFGYFSRNWSHHDSLYPKFMSNARKAYPEFDNVWKHAPIQLEVCGTMQQWKEKGWTAAAPKGEVHKAFQFALEHHASVLNAKRSPIPDEYVTAMQALLRRNGYRYVIDRLRHPKTVRRSEKLDLQVKWSNLGVTPSTRGGNSPIDYVATLNARFLKATLTCENGCRILGDARTLLCPGKPPSRKVYARCCSPRSCWYDPRNAAVESLKSRDSRTTGRWVVHAFRGYCPMRPLSID